MFVDKRFINKAQFDAGFTHGLILKDGVVPARGLHGSKNTKRPINVLRGTDPDPYFI